MVIQREHQAEFWCVAITPERSHVKVFALSIRSFSSGQKKGRAALHIKCGGQTDERIKQRGWSEPHITHGGLAGPHTGHIQSETALLLGQRAQTDNTQSSRLTSPLAARVLLLFMAFLLFLPSSVDNLLMPQQHGGSLLATMPYCCSMDNPVQLQSTTFSAAQLQLAVL